MPSGQALRDCGCPHCGTLNQFYAWSWAGNSKARCTGCGGWLFYDLGPNGEQLWAPNDKPITPPRTRRGRGHNVGLCSVARR